MKFYKEKGSRIRVCPSCGASDIELSTPLDTWLTPTVYVCQKCGFRSPVFAEISPDSVDAD